MSADSRRHAEQATTMATGNTLLRVAWWQSQRHLVDLTGEYGRSYWLPIVGPTCYLLTQSLGTTLARTPETAHPITVPASRLAESLGISGSLGQHAPLVRRPTKPTYGSKQRRLESKSQRGQTKALRGKVPM